MSIKCIPDFSDFVHEKSGKFFGQFLITSGGGRGFGFVTAYHCVYEAEQFFGIFTCIYNL